MNKISGILATSPRIESVDLRNEKPVRSGSVSIGQPISQRAMRPSVVQKETVGGLTDEKFDTSLKKPGQKSEELMIDDIAKDFFMKKREEGPDALSPNTVPVEDASGSSPRLSIRV